MDVLEPTGAERSRARGERRSLLLIIHVYLEICNESDRRVTPKC